MESARDLSAPPTTAPSATGCSNSLRPLCWAPGRGQVQCAPWAELDLAAHPPPGAQRHTPPRRSRCICIFKVLCLPESTRPSRQPHAPLPKCNEAQGLRPWASVDFWNAAGSYSAAASTGLVVATVQSGAPTLKRAKRRTVMFSPSLPTFCPINSLMLTAWSLMKGCSSRQTSS